MRLLLLTAIIVFCALPARAQDITTGLVGHWKLDEASGTTAADSAGDNHGTYENIDPALHSVDGISLRAIDFSTDANSAIVSIPIPAALASSGEVSVSLWVNMDEFSEGTRGLVEISDMFLLRRLSNLSNVVFATRAWSTTNDGSYVGPKLPEGGWTHIVVTYSYNDPPGTGPIYYQDGLFHDQHHISVSGSYVPPSADIRIGRRYDSSGSAFNGVIDDVRIYNRILTPEDVAALYAAWPGHLRYNTNHRVPEYFDGEGWVAAAPKPYVANGVYFDGSLGEGDYLSKGGGIDGVSDSKKLTYSYWINVKESGIVHNVFYMPTLDGGGRHRFGINTGGGAYSEFTNDTGTSVAGPFAGGVPVGAWTHIVCSIDLGLPDGSRGGCAINGSFTAVGATTDDYINFDSPTAVHIGANGSGRTHADLADVWMDTGTYIDLSVEANRRKFIDGNGNPVDLGADGSRPTGSAPDIFLSGDTADWHTNKGTGGGFTENGTLTEAVTAPGGPYAHVPMDGLVGWWRLDEKSGSDVIDYASGNNGTWKEDDLTADVNAGSGVFGGALVFDSGLNTRLALGTTSDLDFSDENAFTIAAWVYPTDENGGGVVFERGSSPNSADFNSYHLRQYPFAPDDWQVQICDATDCPSIIVEDTVSLNQWQHLAARWDGTVLALYKNGVLAGSINTGGVALEDATSGSSRNTAIGANGRDDKDWFPGAIDDVMVWNRALSAAEVATLYNAGFCADPARKVGAIVYHGDFNVLQYCDPKRPNNGWNAMGPVPGAGGAGCATATMGTRPAGSIFFNADFGVMQYCDGTIWRAIGKITDPCDSSPSPGDRCLDGTIYAGLSPDGNVKMYTTPADEGGLPWNNGNSSDYATTSQTSVVTGETNTGNLTGIDADSSAAGTQPHQAAQACADLSAHGHTDWYLPSTNELNVLHENKAAIGGFDTGGSWPAGYYWASSEPTNNGDSTAWGQNFSNGFQSFNGKQYGFSVRCVRKD